MIRLDEATAIEVEKAAAQSVVDYAKSWKKLSEEALKDMKTENLHRLLKYNDIPLQRILADDFRAEWPSMLAYALPSRQEFVTLLTELAVIQQLLTGKPSYRHYP